MERISTLGMSREDWLIARKGGIGGSDAAAVLGLNPYKSPVELFYERSRKILLWKNRARRPTGERCLKSR